jgi:hypothetical protein
MNLHIPVLGGSKMAVHTDIVTILDPPRDGIRKFLQDGHYISKNLRIPALGGSKMVTISV